MLMQLLTLAALALAGDAMPVTLKSRFMSRVGREEWVVNQTVVQWKPEETAIIVVDMWNVHWCHSATTRVGEIATPMNHTLAAARQLGVHIVFAPSDVTAFYKTEPARLRTLALPKVKKPTNANQTALTSKVFPLSSATDGGCDAPAPEGSPWRRQISTLTIDHENDYLIAADLPSNPNAGEYELANVVAKLGLKNLIYMGVHENMCIMERPFAIERVRSWRGADGAVLFPRENIAVMRELVDVMYTPKDPPYVSHAEGLAIHTAYIEKFWGTCCSCCCSCCYCSC